MFLDISVVMAKQSVPFIFIVSERRVLVRTTTRTGLSPGSSDGGGKEKDLDERHDLQG